MTNRFRLYRRNGVYYAHDGETGKQESLRTRDKQETVRLLVAKNEAQDNRLLNLKIAEAHLAAHDPAMNTRTWQDVINYLIDRKGEVKASTLFRMERSYASRPFDLIRNKKLVTTTSEDFLRVLKKGGTSTNLWLRRLHNAAIALDWLLRRVLSQAAWPSIKHKETRAITAEEHAIIMASEKDEERRAYYETLWLTGASPVDVANLTDANIDWKTSTLVFQRQKLDGNHVPACVQIGPRLAEVLHARTNAGPGLLFPKTHLIRDKHRSAEFRRRCKVCKLQGLILYSYRYAWAERARTCGYPERFAMASLGHTSRAIHRAYAKNARVVCPSLELAEQSYKEGKILAFKPETQVA